MLKQIALAKLSDAITTIVSSLRRRSRRRLDLICRCNRSDSDALGIRDCRRVWFCCRICFFCRCLAPIVREKIVSARMVSFVG